LVVALTFGHRSAEDSCSVSERLRSKQSGKGCGNSGSVSRSKSEVSMLHLFPLRIFLTLFETMLIKG